MNKKLVVVAVFFCVVFNCSVAAYRPIGSVSRYLSALRSAKSTSFAHKEAARRFPGMFSAQRGAKSPEGLPATGDRVQYISLIKQRVDYTGETWRSVFLAEHKRVFGEKTDWKYDKSQHVLASESLGVVVPFIFVGDEYPAPVVEDIASSFRVFIGNKEAILKVREALIAKHFCSENDFFFYKTPEGGYGAFRSKDTVLVCDVYFPSQVFACIFSAMQKSLLQLTMSAREMLAEEVLA